MAIGESSVKQMYLSKKYGFWMSRKCNRHFRKSIWNFSIYWFTMVSVMIDLTSNCFRFSRTEDSAPFLSLWLNTFDAAISYGCSVRDFTCIGFYPLRFQQRDLLLFSILLDGVIIYSFNVFYISYLDN